MSEEKDNKALGGRHSGPPLCEDEGCPQHGAPHICTTPARAEAQDEGAAGEPVAWRFRWKGDHHARAWRWAFTRKEAVDAELRGYEVRAVYDGPLNAVSENERLSAELWEARKVAAYYADADLYTVIDRNTSLGHDDGDKARAFLARAHPSPTPAADADRVRIAVEAYLKALDDLEIPVMSPSLGVHRKAVAAQALAALKSTAAKEGEKE